MRGIRSLHVGISPNLLTAVPGGSERLSVSLAEFLLTRGHRVTFFCNSFYGKKQYSILIQLLACAFTILLMTAMPTSRLPGETF